MLLLMMQDNRAPQTYKSSGKLIKAVKTYKGRNTQKLLANFRFIESARSKFEMKWMLLQVKIKVIQRFFRKCITVNIFQKCILSTSLNKVVLDSRSSKIQKLISVNAELTKRFIGLISTHYGKDRRVVVHRHHSLATKAAAM